MDVELLFPFINLSPLSRFICRECSGIRSQKSFALFDFLALWVEKCLLPAHLLLELGCSSPWRKNKASLPAALAGSILTGSLPEGRAY